MLVLRKLNSLQVELHTPTSEDSSPKHLICFKLPDVIESFLSKAASLCYIGNEIFLSNTKSYFFLKHETPVFSFPNSFLDAATFQSSLVFFYNPTFCRVSFLTLINVLCAERRKNFLYYLRETVLIRFLQWIESHVVQLMAFYQCLIWVNRRTHRIRL